MAIFVAAVIPFEGDEVQLILPMEQQLSVDALQRALAGLDTAARKLRAKLPRRSEEWDRDVVFDTLAAAAQAAELSITGVPGDWMQLEGKPGDLHPSSLAASLTLDVLVSKARNSTAHTCAIPYANFLALAGNKSTEGLGLLRQRYTSKTKNHAESFAQAVTNAKPGDTSVHDIEEALDANRNCSPKNARRVPTDQRGCRAEYTFLRGLHAGGERRARSLASRAGLVALRSELRALLTFTTGMDAETQAEVIPDVLEAAGLHLTGLSTTTLATLDACLAQHPKALVAPVEARARAFVAAAVEAKRSRQEHLDAERRGPGGGSGGGGGGSAGGSGSGTLNQDIADAMMGAFKSPGSPEANAEAAYQELPDKKSVFVLALLLSTGSYTAIAAADKGPSALVRIVRETAGVVTDASAKLASLPDLMLRLALGGGMAALVQGEGGDWPCPLTGVPETSAHGAIPNKAEVVKTLKKVQQRKFGDIALEELVLCLGSLHAARTVEPIEIGSGKTIAGLPYGLDMLALYFAPLLATRGIAATNFEALLGQCSTVLMDHPKLTQCIDEVIMAALGEMGIDCANAEAAYVDGALESVGEDGFAFGMLQAAEAAERAALATRKAKQNTRAGAADGGTVRGKTPPAGPGSGTGGSGAGGGGSGGGGGAGSALGGTGDAPVMLVAKLAVKNGKKPGFSESKTHYVSKGIAFDKKILADTLKGLGFQPDDLCISVLLVADYEPSVDKLLKFVHVADITKHPRAVVIPHPRWFADRYAKAAFDAAASTSTFASFFN